MLNQKLKTLLAIVLTFALTLSVAGVSYAQDAEEISELAAPEISEIAAPEIWDGSIAESLEGRGTSADPYIISNGAELALATIRETFISPCSRIKSLTATSNSSPPISSL